MPVLAVRMIIHVVAALTGHVRTDSPAGLPDAIRVWYAWDTPHYLDIARAGYDPGGDLALAVFFPLYPALIGVVSLVVAPLAAAMLISFVATLAAAFALYALVLHDGGDRPMARRAVSAMVLFPTSFALVAPYSEALYLALSIGAILAARLDRWAGAGLLGLFAALARVQGWLLGAVLLVEHFARHRLRPRMLWALAVGVGPLVYLAINQLAYGDPLFFMGQQADHFFHHFEPPWVVIGSLIDGVASPRRADWAILYLAPLASFILLAAVVYWSFLSDRSRPAYAAYALLSFLVLASVSWPISAPRYVGAIFPVFIALADLGRHRWLWVAAMGASGALLLFFTTLFVRGSWAF